MADQQAKLKREVQTLALELANLRLPHKLNQYKVFERRIRAIEKQLTDNENDLKTEVENLQQKLDSAVLCGVSQCCICGGADVQLGSPKHFPVTYNRSVSAAANYTSKENQKRVISSAGRQYGTQVSYHGKALNSTFAEKEVKIENQVQTSLPPDIVSSNSSSSLVIQTSSSASSSPQPPASLSPSISLTPSPTPTSPSPSDSPTPTASPFPECVEDKANLTSNEDSKNETDKVKVKITSFEPKIIEKTASSVVVADSSIKVRTSSPKPSTPPPPPPVTPPTSTHPPLSPKPHSRSPSPNLRGTQSNNSPTPTSNGSIKREKPVVPPPPPPSQSPQPPKSPEPTVKQQIGVINRPKSATSQGNSTSNSSSKPSIFSAAPFRSTASSYRAYKDFISSYTTTGSK